MDEESGLNTHDVSKKDFDVQMKVIIIGDSSVGKSCLLNYYLKNTFSHSSKHTVGVEFG